MVWGFEWVVETSYCFGMMFGVVLFLSAKHFKPLCTSNKDRLTDWKMLVVSCLVVRLNNASIGSSSEPDNQIWKLSPTSSFSVSSMYNLLRPPGKLYRLGVLIWQSKIPSKACFQLWLVQMGKDLTHEKGHSAGKSMYHVQQECLINLPSIPLLPHGSEIMGRILDGV